MFPTPKPVPWTRTGLGLVAESMRWVQNVAGFGQQHEISNRFSFAQCTIFLKHIAESYNRRSSRERGPCVQTMDMTE